MRIRIARSTEGALVVCGQYAVRGRELGRDALRVAGGELRRLAITANCDVLLADVSRDGVRFIAMDQAPRRCLPVNIALGQQIPLAPPAGAATAAFSTGDYQALWLDSAAPYERADCAALLTSIRRTGAGVWGLDAEMVPTLDNLREAADRASLDPDDVTLRRRLLKLLREAVGHAYDADTLSVAVPLPVTCMTAPVHLPGGVHWELQIGIMRPWVSLHERQRYVGALAAAAQRIGTCVRSSGGSMQWL